MKNNMILLIASMVLTLVLLGLVLVPVVHAVNTITAVEESYDFANVK